MEVYVLFLAPVDLTFEFDFQHLVDVLDDVTVWAEGVTGTVHADLQAEVSLCTARGEKSERAVLRFSSLRVIIERHWP